MIEWLRNKTKLQKLQYKYCKLMKSAYTLAPKDKKKSDLIHEEANKIMKEIQELQIDGRRNSTYDSA